VETISTKASNNFHQKEKVFPLILSDFEIYLHSIGESEREATAIFNKVSHDSHRETKKELSQFA
jgi:predicted transcriptional regulator YheO